MSTRRRLRSRHQVENSLPSTCQSLAPGIILGEAHPSKCRKLISCIYFFASRFPLPTSEKQKITKIFAFFVRPFLSLAFCSLVCLLAEVNMTENTKLRDLWNTNNSDFISTPIAPATSVESYEINAALLNLVMKEQFSGLPSEDAASILIPSLSFAIYKRRNMRIMM